MKTKWLKRWIEQCDIISTWSEDTSTKVSCIIIDENSQTQLSIGWNGLPRGNELTDRRLNERPYKYKWFEHAERNAIYNAARKGIALEGSTMIIRNQYPCTDCARAIIQSGISKLYTLEPEPDHPRWGDDMKVSIEMLSEIETLEVFYYDPENLKNIKRARLRLDKTCIFLKNITEENRYVCARGLIEIANFDCMECNYKVSLA